MTGRTEASESKPDDSDSLRHIVLFRMYDHCSDDDVQRMVEELRTLGDLPGIASWTVERSLDERKGRVVVEDATFVSEDALVSFREHPRHRAVADQMASRADWLIGNYWAAPSSAAPT